MHDDQDDDFDATEADLSFDGSAVITCPYCGEQVEITLDAGGGAVQEYVEDCEVCCRPWQLHVTFDLDGAAEVVVEAAG
ncbi:MAG: hypothetical protein CVV20_04945 [Gemmatimonadetes bacterium HGW-Gemmatimonadetes-1]|nr:MAG: hypothetical protein CVV20_04945 [Gemmatimonadetes bacterium HGW-Gemmatimonadetes-1]